MSGRLPVTSVRFTPITLARATLNDSDGLSNTTVPSMPVKDGQPPGWAGTEPGGLRPASSGAAW